MQNLKTLGLVAGGMLPVKANKLLMFKKQEILLKLITIEKNPYFNRF